MGRNPEPMNGKLYESMGVLHVHTLYSDGTGTVSEIARFAAERKLDWLIITDHCHQKVKDQGEEGRYHDKTWVLAGAELGHEDHPNHYLAYGLSELPDQSDPVAMVEDVQKLGGFGAIAHPHEKRSAFASMPPYPWTAWDAPFDGIEIWNQLSQWVEGLTPTNRFHRFLHPLKSLTRPEPETLAIWDIMNRQRPVVGYVGVDAHSLKYPLLGGLFHVKVFHYKVQFRSLLTHLLLDQPLEQASFELASKQILAALQKGRHFGANHRVGNARGFRFYARVNGNTYLPIETFREGESIEFVASSPLTAEMHLIRDGRTVVQVRGKQLRYHTNKAGVWRLEARRKDRGWVYTNPFRVLEA